MPAPDATARRRALIFCILSLGYLLAVFQRLCPAVLATDMMRDLAASGAGIGVLGSAYFYPYALMQLPTGLLVDSWGPRKTIAAFFCLAALGSTALGFSETLTVAVIFRVAVGLGVATLFVAAMKLLAVWYPPEKFAAMAGLLLSMGGVGSLVATAPLALTATLIGWRGSFMAIGALSALLALGAWVLVRNRPEESPASQPSPDYPGAPAGTGSMLANVKTVLTLKGFSPLAGWMFLTQAAPFAFGGLWGGPYLRHVHAYSLADSGLALSFVALGLIAGGPSLGWLSGRFGRRATLIAASTGQSATLAALVLFTDTLPNYGILGVCFGLGFCGTSAAAVAFTALKELSPPRLTGTASGLLNIFPFSAGAVFQPVMGLVLETFGRTPDNGFTTTGYQAAFALLLTAALASIPCALSARETLPGHPRTR